MEFQIEGITENWLFLKKEGRGVEFQGIHGKIFLTNFY